MTNQKIVCTVAVLTYNSAKTLPRCLESIKEFSELIVCDGNSTDDTLDIARAAGAQIIQQDPTFKDTEGRIIDFAGVRNQTLSVAREPWFFFLDSDEEASPELVERIRSITRDARPGAYQVARQYVYNGHLITCSASYPNRQMRLFHLHAVDAFRKKVHERIMVHPDAPIEEITESIWVPVLSDTALLDAKTRHYLDIDVARLHALGRGVLRSALGSGFRNIASFIYRYTRSILFCRGTRMPFTMEIRELRYHIRFIRACARRLWQYD